MRRYKNSTKLKFGITILLYSIILMLISFNNSVLATNYKGGINVEFTINPTISVSLSDDLTIEDLVPGNDATSNTVTVGVETNAAHGYTLTSTVGDDTNNTSRNLETTGDNTAAFASIDFGAKLASLTTDNTWGYSYSKDSGTTWANYNGLPLYNDQTHVATLLNSNHPVNGSVQFKIAAKASETQVAGTYTNVVNFYAVAKLGPPYLYDEVQKQSKGLLGTNVDITASITRDNSGVYEYDSSKYGVSSDANNTRKIYFYRGILDEVTGTYGSDGDGEAYPNYVILSNTGTKATTDTCWRIVRTTGSGGVKMIYNGTWTGTTCANATTAAQIRSTAKITAGSTATFTSAFNGSSQQAVRVGYTYDSTYASNDMTDRSLATLFGTNAGDSNTTNSTIKANIETWYTNNLSGYTSILEPSAGYCNDRTVYNASNVLQPESLEIPQYSTSTTQYNFGARTRNVTTAQLPSLTCATYDNGTVSVDRSKVDLYTVKDSADGNGRLAKPIALLTADEVSFAGSGRSSGSQGSSFNANSYLHSGSRFWLLSPSYRMSDGNAIGFHLISGGDLRDNRIVGTSLGVRPVISLKPGTQYIDGFGTATDPWIIKMPAS